ncbi:hypothetical protein AB6A40_010432 [Gnathostoma spinigerum]|uniref:Uncharacterized protein n=1 Tax=Gnathostoma spinigerum TaxID=75299 RepID=A0ABD6EUU5_9BILA
MKYLHMPLSDKESSTVNSLDNGQDTRILSLNITAINTNERIVSRTAISARNGLCCSHTYDFKAVMLHINAQNSKRYAPKRGSEENRIALAPISSQNSTAISSEKTALSKGVER